MTEPSESHSSSRLSVHSSQDACAASSDNAVIPRPELGTDGARLGAAASTLPHLSGMKAPDWVLFSSSLARRLSLEKQAPRFQGLVGEALQSAPRRTSRVLQAAAVFSRLVFGGLIVGDVVQSRSCPGREETSPRNDNTQPGNGRLVPPALRTETSPILRLFAS